VFRGPVPGGQAGLAAHDEGGLPAGVLGPDDLEFRRQVGVLAVGAHDPVVLREQVLGFAGEPDTGGNQDNQVVTDTFEVRDKV